MAGESKRGHGPSGRHVSGRCSGRKDRTIFAELVEPEALAQFDSAMDQPFVVKGALMPDAHTGYTLPIGAVVATDAMVLPAWVGYDIGCGVCALPTTFSRTAVTAQAGAIFRSIYAAVPVGFNHNRQDSVWDFDSIPRSRLLGAMFARNGLKQLASLGSGNHFIEIGFDETDQVWIIIHSGSRGIGHDLAAHYMGLASGDGKPREGHFGFLVSSRQGKEYLADLNFCLEFALENRFQMLQRVIREISRWCPGEARWQGLVNRNHNHVEEKNGLWIHRKGATQAEAGMMGVIPGNMRDGSFIVEGKGNPASLWSSSHGAGRLMGRKAARHNLDVHQFSRIMGGIVARVDKGTLDESPEAYKDIYGIMALQSELVTIRHQVRPLINIKG